MTVYYAQGSLDTDLTHDDLRAALSDVFRQLEPRRKVLALPPDFTRANSMAGPLCSMTYEYFGDRLTDIMPALGTHVAMPDWQLDRMFQGVPKHLFRVHDWRNDVITIGEVPAEFVAQATEGIYNKPWPAQLNRLVWQGGHDLILSLGQVVPHEVIGMANYNKNLFVGTGGQLGINESHFIGASYGMERMMGRADTPLRRILNYAQDHFCSHLPLLFVLTVIGPRTDGTLAVRGLFIGDDVACFEQAASLLGPGQFHDSRRAAQKGRRLPRSRRIPQHVARQQSDLPHTHGNCRRRRVSDSRDQASAPSAKTRRSIE